MRGAVVGLVLIAATAGCGGSRPAPRTSHSEASTTAPSAAADAGCSDVVILGARGQGQSPRASSGVGEEVLGVTRALRPLLPAGTTARLQAVRYPARRGDATYAADVGAGVRLVGAAVDRLSRRCPRTRVVLVGYSQGAEVMHDAALCLAEPRRLSAAVLLGDPLRDPHDPVTTLTLGTGALSGRGNGGAGPRFAVGVRPRVLTVCVRADDVCNAPPAGRVGPASAQHHTAYQGRAAAHAIAREAARLLRGG